MHYVLNGKRYEGVTPRVRELCEAEQAMKLNSTEGSGAAIAVGLFCAIRRIEPDMEAFRIADLVLSAEIGEGLIETEEEEEESPPEEEPAEEEAGEETEPVASLESRPTSGPRLSAAQG